MRNQVEIHNGIIRILLPDGYTMTLFQDGCFELSNPPDSTVYDDNRVSMGGRIRLPHWLIVPMRTAAILYADKNNMKPIPSYGDHMTIEEFKENCDDGMFTEYDGSGYYATESEVSNIEALPSRIKNGIIETGWTHVVWFNK